MRTDSLSEFIFREIKEMALGYGKLHILMPFYIEELSRHQGFLMPLIGFIYLLLFLHKLHGSGLAVAIVDYCGIDARLQ